MTRVFDLDLLVCPRCGGRLRVLATAHDAYAVQALPATAPALAPALALSGPPC